jgi:hypothetical protein
MGSLGRASAHPAPLQLPLPKVAGVRLAARIIVDPVTYLMLVRTCLANAADLIWARVASEQHQRSLVRGVVELPFQAWEHAGQQVPQPIDHPHSVGDEICSIPDQHGEVSD